MPRIVLLLAACLTLVACDDLILTPYRYGEVEVRATLRNGEPIEDVAFLLYSGTRHLAIEHTDAAGRVVFRYAPQGALGISVEPPRGYRVPEDQPGYVELTLTEGGRHSAVFELVGPGAMRVTVVDTLGAPAIGVWVEVYTGEGVVFGGEVENALPLLVGHLAGDHGVRAVATDRCPVGPGGVVFSDGHWIGDDAVVDVTLVVEPCG